MEATAGIIEKPKRLFVTSADVMELFGCQKSYAGNIIREVNKKAQGQDIHALPAGKANKYHFAKMFDIPLSDIEEVMMKNRRDLMLEDLILVFTNAHKKAIENWTNGEIQNVWIDKEGNVCIAYESGKWWHYCKDKSGKIEWW